MNYASVNPIRKQNSCAVPPVIDLPIYIRYLERGDIAVVRAESTEDGGSQPGGNLPIGCAADSV